jgi:hypothetical protein
METSTYDSCLLFRNDNTHFGIIGLQTDDTLIVADEQFASVEEEKVQKARFECKPAKS